MKKIISRLLLATAAMGITTTVTAQESVEKKYLSNTRQLIYEGKRSGEGYYSADGRYLLFQSERLDDNPFFQIYMLDFETGDINLVSTGKGKTTCAYFDWAGSRTLWASTHLDPEAARKQKDELDFRASGKKRRYAWDYDETMDIFASDRDGKNIKRLTNEKGYDAEGAYSPDGKHIVFSSNREAYKSKLSEEDKKKLEMDPSYFCDVYIMDADGKNVKRLTSSPGYDGGTFFSPDGRKIIWRRFSPDGHQADVYTMDIDGTGEMRVTDFESMSWAPFFHPSMEYIIFCSNKYGYGNFEVFITDREGKKEPVRITDTDGFDGLPVFNPAGNKMVWTGNRTKDGSNQLFIADWNHAAALEALKAAPLRKSVKKVDFTESIKAEELKSKVDYLASDELEGRMTGSEGIRLASEYIRKQFINLGLESLPDEKGMKIPFEYVADISAGEDKNEMKLNGETLKLFEEWTPASSTENMDIKAEAIFAGYGIKTPGDAKYQLNSYNGIDVKDKIVLLLEGEPRGLSEDDKKEVSRYSDLMYKIMIAREMGAKGIVFLTHKEKLLKPSNRSSIIARSGLSLAYANKKISDKILAAAKSSLDQAEEQLRTADPHTPSAFAVPGIKLEIKTHLEKVIATDYNIAAVLTASKPSDEYIVFGGHYDHLGYGEVGSRAEGDKLKMIHNGADDNASGTATVMELAEHFAGLKKTNPGKISKNIVFALWSGEEMGLLGSQFFTEKKDLDPEKMFAYFNFDMVGMLKNNKLSVQGLGSSTDWKKLVEKKNVVAGFDLATSDDPYLPTDATSFYKAKVPVISFFSGLHEHYHLPTDDAANLNYEGMEKIAKFAASIGMELLDRKEKMNYSKVEMASQGGIRGFSVYLGTIPDYAADVQGVKLSGVRAGGPADKAGLKEGDIIIKLAGKDIKNIYDYTNLLGELKPSVKSAITVKREGKDIDLEIIPGAK